MMVIILPVIYKLQSSLYKRYIELFLYNIKLYVKNNFISTISDNMYDIKFYFDHINYTLSNFSSLKLLDGIQLFNYYINIYFPLQIIYKKIYYKLSNHFIFKIPIPYYNNIFVLNGIKRVLLPRLLKTEGYYFYQYKNEDNTINTLKYYSRNKYYNYNIEFDFENLTLDLIFSELNISINLLVFLYLLGYTNTFILQYLDCGNKYYILTLLQKSTFYFYKNYTHIVSNKNIINNLYYYYNNKEFKYILLENLNYLVNFSLNKIYFNNNYYFNTLIVNFYSDNIYSYLSYIYKYFILFLTNSEYSLKIFNLYKEKLLINPLFRFLEEVNNISELYFMYKIGNLYNENIDNLYLKDFKLNQLYNFNILDTNEGLTSGTLLSLTINTLCNSKDNSLYNLYNTSAISLYTTNKNSYITLNSTEQENYNICFNELPIKKEKLFNQFSIPTLKQNILTTKTLTNNPTNLLKVNFRTLLSIPENLIPFIFHNDPTRCLMGAKMQTQAIPLIYKNKPLVLTGYEQIVAYNPMNVTVALMEGIVIYVSSYKIIIRDILNREVSYYLVKYKNSNQKLLIHETPIVWVGERVNAGQILTETLSNKLDELALGNYNLVVYGSYFGYEYEDALIISQRLLYNNIFTSLHIDIYETNFLKTKSTYEFTSILVPNVSAYFLRHLDNMGIIKEGSKVLGNDILIPKLVKSSVDPEYKKSNKGLFKLITNLFGNDILDIKDESIKLFKEDSGRVLKTEVFVNSDKIYDNQFNYLTIRVFIGKLRYLEVGDKLCGRHGNKGIVTYVSKPSDFPYVSSIGGVIPTIITGALGVPSRLNMGQLYEGLLGLSCFYLDIRHLINLNVNSVVGINYLKNLIYNNLRLASVKTSYKDLYNPYTPGRYLIRDGRTGQQLKGSVCLGVLQYYKLIHIIKDKIQYRTVGSYTQLTQQPIKGRLKDGGQRFGEMEVWALEAYGTAYTLKELLNYRSDDIEARQELIKMLLIGGDYIKVGNLSETFKLILSELKSLTIDIKFMINYKSLSNKYFDIKYC